MTPERILFVFGAMACWWISILWLVTGFRVARSYAAAGETAETLDVIRVVLLRSAGISLVGVQMFLFSIWKTRFESVPFWPAAIGSVLFATGRLYMFLSHRAGRKAFH